MNEGESNKTSAKMNAEKTQDISRNQKLDNKKTKAVALLSGGLDSQLAVRMIKEQGVEVEAVAIKTPFCDFDCGKGCGHKVLEVATELDVKIKTVYLGKEYLTMLKNPKYGYGSGANPCIDCRMMMYEEAKKHMDKIGASFVITGEVLHQRPMSQNSNALSIIERETDMEGKILRPLSAKLLSPTTPEITGLVDRSLLGSIRGRSRKGQLDLAATYGITNPPNAAGGCLLTDPQFSKRVKDLFKHMTSQPSINDMELLKIGRHFRLDSNSKLIVGRNHGENEKLLSYCEDKDFVIQPALIPGPVSILRFHTKSDLRKHKKLLRLSARITLRYSDTQEGKSYEVKVTNKARNWKKSLILQRCERDEVEAFRI
ncbi:tRNA (5-methylaminomethyl-2-thiouridylate)-methyltransferase [Candidatus Nitrosocosmicus franklandus]|uniref:Uncharacterized protein n=1 Tax=Candidatus Nitrosocosmicus franklandianus TaxID=1798806 RepID=A0A484IFX1_9ARCH|nr:tRNA (5-methylaminomethyl-2-thiouridylate)-methyltransferase [Candidatus Nitrosocosmicus franklandus]VFJ15050.1 conserved protein of unknown function [Candidatus Nitrosocosmicus franklandus]